MQRRTSRGQQRQVEESFGRLDERAIAGARFEQQPLRDLIDDYSLTRRASIAFFRSLSGEAWLRRGTVAGYSATVRGLAFHIAGHELHHLGVIGERYLSKILQWP